MLGVVGRTDRKERIRAAEDVVDTMSKRLEGVWPATASILASASQDIGEKCTLESPARPAGTE